VLDVLRVPGARRLFLASCVARLPMGAFGLLLVLHTQALTGSYAQGGAAAAAYTVGLGVTNPILGRIVDRRGQTALLRTTASLACAAMIAVALLPDAAPGWAIVAMAAATGALQPPIGACMRAMWPSLLESREARNAAYGLEAAVLEVVYICGPVLIVAGIGAWSLRAALAACGVALLLGNLVFAASPVSRAWHGTVGEGSAPRASALRGAPVRLLFGVFVLCGLAVGAIEVAVPAALDAMGHRGLVGLLLGLWGAGSLLAGVAVARIGPGSDPPRRLAWLLVAWGVAHAVVGIAASPGVLGVLLLLAGATIAPTFVCANGLLDRVSLPGTLTESSTWISTGMSAGIAAGSALAGASPGVALAALGAGGVLAGGLVSASSAGTLRPV
jgi:MFS family permease